MILVAAPLLGLVVAALLWRGLGDMFDRPTFRRTNYRGHELATAAGLVVSLAMFATTAAVVTLGGDRTGRAGAGPAGPDPHDPRRSGFRACSGCSMTSRWIGTRRASADICVPSPPAGSPRGH